MFLSKMRIAEQPCRSPRLGHNSGTNVNCELDFCVALHLLHELFAAGETRYTELHKIAFANFVRQIRLTDVNGYSS